MKWYLFFSNACDKGESEKFVEDNEEFVDTEFAAGSMVWAKMKGYPWWPAMVDFCPDTDEYYWLEAWSKVRIRIQLIVFSLCEVKVKSINVSVNVIGMFIFTTFREMMFTLKLVPNQHGIMLSSLIFRK